MLRLAVCRSRIGSGLAAELAAESDPPVDPILAHGIRIDLDAKLARRMW
jgi:hypothetical protein